MNLIELLEKFKEIEQRAAQGENVDHLMAELRAAWDTLTDAIGSNLNHESDEQ